MKKRKSFSILLALWMVLTIVPTNVFAVGVEVDVRPSYEGNYRGGREQFYSYVDGTTNKNVWWEVSGNNKSGTYIDSNGLLHIADNETARFITVKAVSMEDSSQYDTAEVEVYDNYNYWFRDYESRYGERDYGYYDSYGNWHWYDRYNNDGYYDAYGNWHYYDRTYYDYDRQVYPTSLSLYNSGRGVSGRLRNGTSDYVAVYKDGRLIGSGYSDRDGYFDIAFNEYVNRSSDLEFFSGYGYYRDYKYYKTPVYETRYSSQVSPWNVDISAYTVTGNYNAFASLDVYYDGSYLGRITTGADGGFALSSGTRLYDKARLSFYGTPGVNPLVTETKPVATTTVSTLTIGSKTLTTKVNGFPTSKEMDVAPYLKNDRTMLPLRYVGETLGYEVTWNDMERTAILVKDNTLILVPVDKETFSVNGEVVAYTAQPEIVDGRIMLPISDIGRALGLSQGNIGQGKNIEWDGTTRTVTITR